MFSFLRTAMDYIQSASGLKVKPQSAELMDDDSEVMCMKRAPSSRKSAFFSSLLISSALPGGTDCAHSAGQRASGVQTVPDYCPFHQRGQDVHCTFGRGLRVHVIRILHAVAFGVGL